MRHPDLYLVRHGETDWNAVGRLQGCSDCPLNETGRKQAHQVAEKFNSHPVKAVYSSHLTRAKETAQIIASHHSCLVVEEFALREGEMGSSEGMLMQDYFQKFERERSQFLKLPKRERMQYKISHDIETIGQIADRAVSFLRHIVVQHAGETVIAVTHGGLIRAVIMALSHWEEVSVENGGYLHLKGMEIRRLEGINAQ